MKFYNHYKMGCLIWENMAKNDMPLPKIPFVLGNLVPDFTIFFLIKLHSYASCACRVNSLLRRLYKCNKSPNRFLFSIRAGIMSHYVCDFLCYPHTSAFKGSIREHALYEKNQTVSTDDIMLPFNKYESMDFNLHSLTIALERRITRREKLFLLNTDMSSFDIAFAIHVATWTSSAAYIHVEKFFSIRTRRTRVVPPNLLTGEAFGEA